MTSTTRTRERQASISVPITAGNLRNGHVYIREYLWFFPKSAIRGERVGGAETRNCTLELADFRTVETDIDATKAIFRWRGWKKFFGQHGVKEGDRLIFLREEPYRFAVSVQHTVLEGFEKLYTLGYR